MSRRYAHPVEVRAVPRDGAPGPRAARVTPDQFVWRGRLYVVRGVLAHWIEVGPWWREATVRGGVAATEPVAAQESAGAAAAVPGERAVWRVEAAVGRSAAPGVYDLCLDTGCGRWTLARSLD